MQADEIKNDLRLLRSLFEESADAFYRTERDGAILDFNRAFCSITGFGADELKSMNIKEMYADPSDRATFRSAVESTGGLCDYELRLRRKDGSLMLCLITSTLMRGADGEILGYQGIMRDITEQRRRDEALRLSEEKFSKAFRHSPDWIVISRLEDGVFIEVNDAYLKITGFSRDEVIGKSSLALGLWVDPKERDAMVRELKERGSIKDHEVKFRMKSGSVLTMLRSAELIELNAEKCLISVTRDITERKRYEERLESLAEELRKSNRELEQFASVASHDLKSPLITLAGFLSLFKRRNQGKISEDSMELIDTALTMSDRMQHLISDLLAYARAGEGEWKTELVDFNAVVKRVIDNLRASIVESGADIAVGDMPEVEANAMMLTQLMQNLISNALKFCDSAPRIDISCKRGADEYEFSVADNGMGVPPEMSERIFEAFTRGSADRPGAGLGLAICKKIVQCHGGRIFVRPNSPNGSVFVFTLPLPAGAGRK